MLFRASLERSLHGMAPFTKSRRKPHPSLRSKPCRKHQFYRQSFEATFRIFNRKPLMPTLLAVYSTRIFPSLGRESSIPTA